MWRGGGERGGSFVVLFCLLNANLYLPPTGLQVIGALACWPHPPPQPFLVSYAAAVQLRLTQYGPASLHLLLGSLAALGFLPQRGWLAAWLSCARPKLR